ncbi:MAG: phosphate signaling complex protein PhoU [Gammaproteobacteria bacterium]|nr:phosphate signaling complex protein PhoU [Gammaproteobacteria bacterium]
MNIGQHISQQFNEELEDIRNHVMAMGGLVEQQLSDAIIALVECNRELGEQVISNDHRVNGLEVNIDEECSRVLARRQPAAGDLRLIVAVIKTITDLERIGDQAERVGRMAVRLVDAEMKQSHYVELQHIGNHVREMLHSALDAFARMDPVAALNVAREDIKVDNEYESIMRQLMTFMMEDPRTISRVLDVMWAARALERIGDHARNISEYVIYLVKGKDVRHVSLDQMEEEVRSER